MLSHRLSHLSRILMNIIVRYALYSTTGVLAVSQCRALGTARRGLRAFRLPSSTGAYDKMLREGRPPPKAACFMCMQVPDPAVHPLPAAASWFYFSRRAAGSCPMWWTASHVHLPQPGYSLARRQDGKQASCQDSSTTPTCPPLPACYQRCVSHEDHCPLRCISE